MAASGAGSDESGIDAPLGALREQVPPALPSCMADIHKITRTGTRIQRRKFGSAFLQKLVQPASGRVILGHGGFGAVFKVEIPEEAAPAAAEAAPAASRRREKLAVKVVFNYGLSSSKAETNDTQKEFDVLTRIPVHRNLIRLVFECVAKPPLWMVQRLPEPSLVCLAEDSDDEGGDEMGRQPLQPRKAQVIGLELLRMPLCDKLEKLEARTGAQIKDDFLVCWSRDIAEGVHHLLQHGVVHRDLKLDNVMWDSKGGPEGVGRVVLIDLGCSLRVDATGAAGDGSPSIAAAAAAAAAEAASGSPASGTSDAPDRDTEDRVAAQLDACKFSFLQIGGDAIGGNQAHLAPEVLDGWNRGVAGDRDATVPHGKQASWALGVLLHEVATGGAHPFGEGYPGELPDESKVTSGGLGEALAGYSGGWSGAELLVTRPDWLRELIRGLLRIDPKERTRVCDAVRVLHKGGKGEGFSPAAVTKLAEQLLGSPEAAKLAASELARVHKGIKRVDLDTLMMYAWCVRSQVFGKSDADGANGSEIDRAVEIAKSGLLHCLQSAGRNFQVIVDQLAEPDRAGIAVCCLDLLNMGGALAGCTFQISTMSGLFRLTSEGAGHEQLWALRILEALAIYSSPAVRSHITQCGAPGALAPKLRSIGAESQAAASAISMLVSSVHSKLAEDYVAADCVPALVELLQVGAGVESNRQQAARALAMLAQSNQRNRSAVLGAGAVPALAPLLLSTDLQEAEEAAAAICNIAAGPSRFKTELLDQAGVVHGLAGLLYSEHGSCARKACAALCNIVQGSDGQNRCASRISTEDQGMLMGAVVEARDRGVTNARWLLQQLQAWGW